MEQKKQTAVTILKKFRQALDIPNPIARNKEYETLLSDTSILADNPDLVRDTDLQGRISAAHDELRKIIKRQTPRPISFAQKLQQQKEQKENRGRRVDPKRRGNLQAQKYRRFLKKPQTGETTKLAVTGDTVQLSPADENTRLANTGTTQNLQTPEVAVTGETTKLAPQAQTGQTIQLKPEPSSSDVASLPSINTTVRSVKSAEIRKPTGEIEPTTTGVVGNLLGGQVIYKNPNQIAARPTISPSAKLAEYYDQAQRVTQGTLKRIAAGEYGSDWQEALKQNPQAVARVVSANVVYRTIGNYTFKERDDANKYRHFPEVKAAMQRRDLLEARLRKEGLLTDKMTASPDFVTSYESAVQGINNTIHDTKTFVDKPFTDDEYIESGVSQQVGLLNRFRANRPKEADAMDIPKIIENRSIPPLSNPQLPYPEDIFGIRSKITSKFTNLVSKEATGKAGSTVTGQATSAAAKEAAAKLTAQLTVFAAKKGVMGLLAGLALKGVAALGTGGVALLLSLVPSIVKFIRKHAKDLAAIGAGIFALGAFAGSVVFAGIGVGILGVGLASGATFVGMGATIAGFIAAIIFPAIIIPILIAMITVVFFVSIVLFIINTGGYITPYAEPLAPPNAAQSEFFDVAELINPPGPFQNSNLPIEVTYTIAIKANDEALSSITFLNTYNITQSPLVAQAPNPTIPEDAEPSATPPTTIDANGLYTIKYKARFDNSFKDSIVCNNFTVSADADGNPSSETTSACVTIGNPPDECPSGWPVDSSNGQTYGITQGPNTALTHPGEAVDVALRRAPRADDFILATHRGKIVNITKRHPVGGNYLLIRSVCNGKQFDSYYGHMRAQAFAAGLAIGQEIPRGTKLGLVGKTGYAYSGEHVHYQFNNGLQMLNPYIPTAGDLLKGCVGFDFCGKITIP